MIKEISVPRGDYAFMIELKAFVESDMARKCKTLIIGCWGDLYSGDEVLTVAAMVDLIIKHKYNLVNLEEIVFNPRDGRVFYTETCDMTELLESFPKLSYFSIYGTEELRFEKLMHPSLKELRFASPQLSDELVDDLAQADLPNLERLYFNLQDGEQYAYVDDREIAPLFQNVKLKKLSKISFVGCFYLDSVVRTFANSPLSKQLTEIDFSKGALSSDGFDILFSGSSLSSLKVLNLKGVKMNDALKEKIANFNQENGNIEVLF